MEGFTPVNMQERIQIAQLERLDALCNMMSSFIEVYGKEHNVATEGVESVAKVLPKTTATKSEKTKTTTTRKPRAKKPKE